MRTCVGPTGQWSGITPTCERKYKAISNGVLQSPIEEQILCKEKKTSRKGPDSCNDTIIYYIYIALQCMYSSSFAFTDLSV